MNLCNYIRDTPLECPYMPNRKLIVPALIYGGAALAGAAINFFANRKSNTQNERINERQIEYSREAFDREKDYNNWLLANQQQLQMQDAKAAGVNPAFVNGSQLGGVSISPHQQVPSQLPMNYQFDTSGINAAAAGALNFYQQKKLIDAQAENLIADKYKKLAETDRQLIENQYLPQLLKGQVDINTSVLGVNGSIQFKNEWEAKSFAQSILESSKRVEQIGENINLIKAQVENLSIENRIKLIEEYWKSDQCKAEIENLRSSAGLSRQQAQDILATQASRIMLLDSQGTSELYKQLHLQADTENMKNTHRLITIEGDHMEFNLNSDKKYRNKERALGLIVGATQATKNFTSAVGDLMGSFMKQGKFLQGFSKPSSTAPVTPNYGTPPPPMY